MGLYFLIYHILVVLSIVISFVALYRGHKKYFSLLLVLIFTELVEMFAQIAVLKNFSFVWVYLYLYLLNTLC